ncbi:MAG: magnesium-translocating P-type ATPase [Parachlamydiaceae bacterium]
MNFTEVKRVNQFWSSTVGKMFVLLQTNEMGLSFDEAKRRIGLFGFNTLEEKKQTSALRLFIFQFTDPFILLLLFAAILSSLLDNATEAYILLSIVGLSGISGFIQEYRAIQSMSRLLQLINLTATVLREGETTEIPLEEVVPGDIVFLKAGDMVPGDSLLIESKDLAVNEATFTGEFFSVDKMPGVLPAMTPLSKQTNTLYMGSHITSGFGKALVIYTGKETLLNQLSNKLYKKASSTAFEKGIQQFSFTLMILTAIFAVAIFSANYFLDRPIIQSFLFTLALSIGLVPQLLPAIITINLTYGVQRMARQKVVVKKLNAIENAGSIDILCADKTGTLTKGEVELYQTYDTQGKESSQVHLYAYLNAYFQTGYKNPIDHAILQKGHCDCQGWLKLDEIPYDFRRKRLSVLLSNQEEKWLIIKGAFKEILSICTKVEGEEALLPQSLVSLQERFQAWNERGFRVLGLAYKKLLNETVHYEEEKGATFLGFLLFYDPPKAHLDKTVASLNDLGISLKILTGDNAFATSHLASHIGLSGSAMISGDQLEKMDEKTLLEQVERIHVFTDLDPFQKLRIITALRKNGHAVGYIGDGVNDLGALRGADVSFSVDSAIDLAKEIADIVLFDKDLDLVCKGIIEGRKTFANTLKYILIAASANFGNMFSMAAASLLLPFLPLLPSQILLTNLLTDFSEIAIATDHIDPEVVKQQSNWDIRIIHRFMIVFGLISSFFDFMTFGMLLFILKASPEEFRTGWFLESVISATLVTLFIRTKRPVYQSKPSHYLLFTIFAVMLVSFLIPYSIFSELFQLVPLEWPSLAVLGGIISCYLLTIELIKRAFYENRFIPK